MLTSGEKIMAAIVAGLLLETVTFVGPLSSTAETSATSFSGQAVVMQITALGHAATLVDTGPLESSGGAEAASLLEGSAPGILTAEVLDASTVGLDQRADSAASLANLNLTVGGNTITAGFLMAQAAAECQSGVPATNGTSEI